MRELDKIFLKGTVLIDLRKARRSRPEAFCNKVALKNFAKFTGKHLCWSLFFNKGAILSPLKNTFFIEQLW